MLYTEKVSEKIQDRLGDILREDIAFDLNLPSGKETSPFKVKEQDGHQYYVNREELPHCRFYVVRRQWTEEPLVVVWSEYFGSVWVAYRHITDEGGIFDQLERWYSILSSKDYYILGGE